MFSMALAGAGFEVVWRRRGVDFREISNAIVGHSVVSLKLGYSGTEGEVLGIHCRRLRYAGGAGCFLGLFPEGGLQVGRVEYLEF